MSAETLAIAALGAQGDGIAETADGPIYVPFTLAGETVTVMRETNRGRLTAVETAAAARVEPPCPHFGPNGRGGACGGCKLQHMASPAYEAWKRGLVINALEAQGLRPEVAPLFACAPGTRRRLVMTARRIERGILLGFNAAASHRIVAIDTCVIADRRIVAGLAALRAMAAAVCATPKPFRLTVLASETGLDVAIEGAGRLPEHRRRGAVETVLGEKAVARLTVDGETLVETRKPVVPIGAGIVTPPPGGFVQASAAAEARMADLVLAHLSGCRQVADLFAGSGTFALRLARQSAVRATESDAAALAALDAAARHTPGLKRVTIERRDLYRRPVTAAELKGFDGAVFDPPRAGAEAQAREFARSGIGRIAAVSCNPVTLARDLRPLADAGYHIDAVHPIDQFLWSPHVEAVALLSRG